MSSFSTLMTNFQATDLERFKFAQAGSDGQNKGICTDYETALQEIQAGEKTTHWIWYIFPQLGGLIEKASPINRYFSIKSIQEAKDFESDHLLMGRLKEATQALLDHQKPIRAILKNDAEKVRSCWTLFSMTSEDPLFDRAIDQVFKGQKDQKTLDRLQWLSEQKPVSREKTALICLGGLAVLTALYLGIFGY